MPERGAQFAHAKVLALMRGLPGREMTIGSVYATLDTFVHGDRTDLDDHAVVTIRYAGDRLGWYGALAAAPATAPELAAAAPSMPACTCDAPVRLTRSSFELGMTPSSCVSPVEIR